METRWSADLSTLLRINRGFRFGISIRGSDTGSTTYQHAIVNHFAQTPANHRRGGKCFPLLFPLKFVPYDEKNIFSSQQTSDFITTPFVHLFFISAAFVEEYRTSVRHNVSEWFATLSHINEAQWIIVVDTTRAKEKKNRAQLLDRLKSDFSKHTHKLIEVSESVEHSSFNSLVQTIQSLLLAHIDLLIDTWERHLKTTKDYKGNDTWDVYSCINQHMDFARFFWSLNSLEHSLKLYDELDAFLFHVVLHASRTTPPAWLSSLSCSLPICPILSSTMYVYKVEEKYKSFVGARHVLLTQQLLLTIFIYQQRLRAPSGVAPSIRVDFAAILMKYAHHALQTVVEQGKIHNLLPCSYRLSVWIIFLVREVLSLVGLLADASSVDGATHAACQIHIMRFDAILLLSQLCDSDKSEERQKLLDWIANMDSQLTEMIQNESVMMSQVQKTHDTTHALLTQFGRTRMGAAQGMKLAEYLESHNRSQNALPYQLRFVLNLIEGGERSTVVRHAIQTVIPKLTREDDVHRLSNFWLFLALYSPTHNDRVEAFEKVTQLLKGYENQKVVPSISVLTPFSCYIGKVGTVVLVPGDSFRLPLHVTSHLPMNVHSLTFRVYLRHINKTSLHRIPEPAFESSYTRDGTGRLICVHSGKEEMKEEEDERAQETPLDLIFEKSGVDVVLSPGENILQVTTVVKKRGFYLLEKIEISFCNDAMVITLPADDIPTRDRPLAITVQKTPNKLDIGMKAVLLAGVVQRVTLWLEAGARHIPPSELTVYAKDADKLEFMTFDGSWTTLVAVPVPEMVKGDRHSIEIEICRILSGDVVTQNESFSEKVFFEWQGQTWPVDLAFKPLFVLNNTTTQLEARVLFEAEMSRPTGIEYIIQVAEAVLEYKKVADGHLEETPAQLAKFLNNELPPVPPNSVVGMVWMLGVGSDAPLDCTLKLRYSVKPTTDSVTSFVHKEYEFESRMSVNAPKVEYELCSQMLSQQPGAQLCRAGTPCDMVISIRSLTYRIESLYVALDAEERFWTLQERAKVVHMKESGLGQIAFTVIPSSAGFLPYPQVNVFSAHVNQMRTGDGFWSEAIEYTSGMRLVSFQRTAGKQIRVLGGMGEKSSGNEREQKGVGGIREKLGKLKLFD